MAGIGTNRWREQPKSTWGYARCADRWDAVNACERCRVKPVDDASASKPDRADADARCDGKSADRWSGVVDDDRDPMVSTMLKTASPTILIKPGAQELCDGVDNDCDNKTDETFIVGQPCSTGTGCKRDGQFVCIANGLVVRCDAVEGQPEPAEQCDRIDNDCDGSTDRMSTTAVSLVPYNPAERMKVRAKGRTEMFRRGAIGECRRYQTVTNCAMV